jgi:hypothetical protein
MMFDGNVYRYDRPRCMHSDPVLRYLCSQSQEPIAAHPQFRRWRQPAFSRRSAVTLIKQSGIEDGMACCFRRLRMQPEVSLADWTSNSSGMRKIISQQIISAAIDSLFRLSRCCRALLFPAAEASASGAAPLEDVLTALLVAQHQFGTRRV